MKRARLIIICVVMLTLVALGLRVRGIDHGLPTTLEQDCKIPHQVDLLRDGGNAWRTDKDFAWYPLLIAHIATLWPEPRAAEPEATLEEHLTAAALPQVQVRLTVAMLAVLAIPLTYLLASWFIAREWALIAAAFVAFSLLHHNFSQQSRPHAVSTTLFVATVIAAVRMRRKGNVVNYAIAGACCALSIGCIQSGVMLLPALVVAHFARRSAGSAWRHLRFLVLLVPIALALPFFYPTIFFGAQIEGAAGARQFGFDPSSWTIYLGGHEIFLRQFLGRGLRPTAWALWSYEPILSVLVVLAGLMCVPMLARNRREAPNPDTYTRRRDAWVVLSFVVPYAVCVLAYERTYERFLLPLLPFLALAAAFALARSFAWSTRRLAAHERSIAGITLALGALMPCVWASWRLATIRAAPHTTQLAATWLTNHAAATQDIALWPGLDVPLAREPNGLKSWMGEPSKVFFWPWTRYQASLEQGHGPLPLWRLRWWVPRPTMLTDPAEYVRRSGGELLVAEVFAHNRTSPGATNVRDELRDPARSGARLLERISPDGDPAFSEHPLGYQEETSVRPPHFFARVLAARRTGPVIEIYELPRR